MAARIDTRWDRVGLVNVLLMPLSGLYTLGWMSYLAMYGLGLKRAQQPHRPIVCVGNLVAGGIGKSPLTLWIARELLARGRSVVLGANGYGSPRQQGASLAPNGPLDPAEWGDEPAMMRWLMPEIPLVVGKKRVDAARLVAEHHPGAVLLMDDGVQHLPLARDINLVLDAAPANRLTFPAGPYREPRSVGLRRAHRVLVPGIDLLPPRLSLMTPDRHPWVASGPVNALCAIGNPERFWTSLRVLGLTLNRTVAWPDHDPLSSPMTLAHLDPAVPLVVTAKDYVKLARRTDLVGRTVVIAQMEAVPADPEGLMTWLMQELERVDRQTTSR
jgi:tetraacyldisaccharide 4'-kinase